MRGDSIPSKRKCLVIGVGRYSMGPAPLSYALDDARRVSAALAEHGRFVAEEPLLDPDFKTLNDRLRTFVEALEGELGLIYFAGHGWSNGRELRLLARDSGTQGDGGVALPDVWRRLGNARLLLVLECCYAGEIVKSLLSPDTPSVLVLGAARAAESAVATRTKGGHLTHHFCRAMAGETLPPHDLFLSVQKAMRQDTAFRQRAFIGLNGWQPQGEDLNPDGGGGSVADHLAHVEAICRRFAPLLGDDAPCEDPNHLYVDLNILAEHETRRPTLRRLLEVDRAENSGAARRWMVWGEPGLGKTTMLRHLVWELCRQDDRPWVPVYFELRDISEGPIAARLSRAVKRRADEGDAVFLLDALDEVPPGPRRHLRDTLIPQLHRDFPRAPIVVTSRRVGVAGLDRPFIPARIEPMDEATQQRLLQNWLGSEEAGRQAMERIAGARLDELAGNPLYLSLIAVQFRRGADVAVSANRAIFYRDAIETLLNGYLKDPPTPVDDPGAALVALRRVAWHLTAEARGDGASLAALVRCLNTDVEARDALAHVPTWSSDRHAFLAAVADEGAGLLSAPLPRPNALWTFHHRSFREALTAAALNAMHDQTDDQSFASEMGRLAAGDPSLFAEPLALMTGLIDAPDALIHELVTTVPDLGLRAMATAPTLSERTLLEAIGVADDLEERRAALLRMPEQLGDPERALTLVGRLASALKGDAEALAPDDLWFLTETCRAIAQRWADQDEAVADAAAEREAWLYAQRPAPPENLVPCVDIAAGTFRMGSPPGVGHDTERPRHVVAFDQPFRLSATTVTRRHWASFLRNEMAEGAGDAELPVAGVTWYAAMAFCRWLEPKGRLPTEAEWEYACRAGEDGDDQLWCFGDDEARLRDFAWYRGNAESVQPVAGRLPNAWGLYDMHGNVWEWCRDWFGSYAEGPATDPHGPSRGEPRVMRGGCPWDSADGCRSAFRDPVQPADAWFVHGFRVRLPAAPSSAIGGRP